MTDAPRLTGVAVSDPPGAWRAAGFVVDADRFTVGGVTIVGADAGVTPRIALAPPVDGVVDGVAFGAVADAVSQASHPNRVRAVDHVAVHTGDLDRTVDAFAVHGLHPRRTAEDLRAGEGRRYAFYVVGTCVLEVVAPTVAHPGRAAVTGVAFTADDLDHLPTLRGAVRPAVQPGRSIAVLDTEALGLGMRVAVLTPR